MITVSKEDYLKAVSEAEAEGQTVIAATLAHWLSVSRPAVATALKRLKKDGLVIVKSDPAGFCLNFKTIYVVVTKTQRYQSRSMMISQ
jgi:DNA-binding MarR family transcriptional regulator